MPRIDNETFYINAIKKYGQTAEGVCWHSKVHQEIRFEKLLELLPTDLSGETLLDAGCGFGDFYTYLLKNKREPKEYLGVDSIAKMCHITTNKTVAKTLHQDICKEALPAYDYICCSGALNILTPYETHAFIRNCYTAANKAFFFNVLYGSKDSSTYNYLNKDQISAIAKELQVKKVVFIQEYLPSDITVGFFR